MHKELSLGPALTKRFFGAALIVFTLAIAAILSYGQYRNQELIRQSLEAIFAQTTEAMTVALWNYDRQQINSLAESFQLLQGVQQVLVIDNFGTVLFDSTIKTKQPLNDYGNEWIVLPYVFHRDQTPVGEARILLTDDTLFAQLGVQIVVLIVLTFFIVFGLSLYNLHLLNTFVVEPLSEIIKFVRATPPGRLVQSDRLLKLPTNSDNELGVMVNALNQFAVDLRTEHKARMQAEAESSQLSLEIDRINRATAAQSIAALIAHEINQPLAAALINSEAALSMLESESINNPEIKLTLTDVLTQMRRASEVVGSIQRLVKRTESATSEISVDKAVKEAMQLVAPEAMARQIALVSRLSPNDIRLFLDKTQLQRILINLLRNALEAISNDNVPQGEIVIEAEPIEGNFVAIHVLDNGPGIDASLIDQAIRPFFTTKNEGSGIGLWMTQLLVEANGGRLEYQNQIDSGARFTVILPTLTGNT